MRNDSRMTRQQYQRLRSLNSLDRMSGDNSFRKLKSKHLAHHLNRMILILVILIVIVYLILIFVNF